METPALKKRRAPRHRIPVLLVLNSDGYVECYGEPGLTVHVVHRLDVHSDDEILADDFLTASLPPRFRGLYFPINLRATGLCGNRTASDEAERRFRLELVRELAAIGKGPPTAPAAITRARRAKR
jgi:hypothetical protein